MMVESQPSRWDATVDTAFRRIVATLIVTVWCSAIIFGLYIILFYLNAYTAGDLARWNEGASEFYTDDTPAATGGIGIHFLGGAIVLILGSIQFVEPLRKRYPRIHRWIGRLYIAASFMTAIGGLVFIFTHGTIGGLVMDIGFTLYGILMLVATIETLRHARANRFDTHRVWAYRLYVLAIASWLYRMEYGFWFLFTEGVGSTPNLTGPFDQVMAFFFYIPNLLILELFLRARNIASQTSTKAIASVVLLVLTGALVIMTLGFMAEVWGPAITGERPL